MFTASEVLFYLWRPWLYYDILPSESGSTKWVRLYVVFKTQAKFWLVIEGYIKATTVTLPPDYFGSAFSHWKGSEFFYTKSRFWAKGWIHIRSEYPRDSLRNHHSYSTTFYHIPDSINHGYEGYFPSKQTLSLEILFILRHRVTF